MIANPYQARSNAEGDGACDLEQRSEKNTFDQRFRINRATHVNTLDCFVRHDTCCV
jgi:hypothetical protein